MKMTDRKRNDSHDVSHKSNRDERYNQKNSSEDLEDDILDISEIEENENTPRIFTRPLKVGITHGDINGVGYEVILKTLNHKEIGELFTPVIFGSWEIINEAIKKFKITEISVAHFDNILSGDTETIYVVDVTTQPAQLMPGEITKEAGDLAVAALESAVKALKKGEIDVLVTAPICKENVQSEKFNFPGHTEFLEACDAPDGKALMILCDGDLRVTPATIHVPLEEVKNKLSVELIKDVILRFNDSLKRDFGIRRPRIAVLSFNPHAGDGGLLGKEEQEIIIPAIEMVMEEGILAFGPFAADGFFGKRHNEKFDGVVAMYHDQGLIPFKMLAGDGGVNFTSGLSFVRTSPDHGTAFDIAWKDEANADSMRDAIYEAIDIYRRRKSFDEAMRNPLKKFTQNRRDKDDGEVRHGKTSYEKVNNNSHNVSEGLEERTEEEIE